jgi:hypothetical protein
MLLQPKNDHILFAFFGISLQIRRRSAATKAPFHDLDEENDQSGSGRGISASPVP